MINRWLRCWFCVDDDIIWRSNLTIKCSVHVIKHIVFICRYWNPVSHTHLKQKETLSSSVQMNQTIHRWRLKKKRRWYKPTAMVSPTFRTLQNSHISKLNVQKHHFKTLMFIYIMSWERIALLNLFLINLEVNLKHKQLIDIDRKLVYRWASHLNSDEII